MIYAIIFGILGYGFMIGLSVLFCYLGRKMKCLQDRLTALEGKLEKDYYTKRTVCKMIRSEPRFTNHEHDNELLKRFEETKASAFNGVKVKDLESEIQNRKMKVVSYD
jgi:hypothetical protein